ncbi:MAG: VWA domain-containing protein [Kofleriaceae bacterium]
MPRPTLAPLLPSLGLPLLALAAACAGSGAGDHADGNGGNVGAGGAQDLGVFRDVIERGQIPSPTLLDPNGFFAEHYVEQPPADCGETLCVSAMFARGKDWVTGERRSTLQVALTTPVDPATLPRRPLSLVIVVDRSGSMAEDGRLLKVQRGLRLLVEQLQPEDRVALVSFDDRVELAAPLTASPQELYRAIDALTPRGGTNLHAGLRAGLQLGQEALPERDRRVLLLSDGLATAGEVSSSAIEAMAQTYVRTGVGLSTIGVGTTFDFQLMRDLAEVGAGNFYFLEDAAAVDEVFTEELAISMSPLALDISLTVTPRPRVTIERGTGRGADASGTIYLPAAFSVSRTGAPPTNGRRGGGAVWFFDLEGVDLAEGAPASLELSYALPGQPGRFTQRVDVPPLDAPADDATLPTVSRAAMLKQVAMYNVYLGLLRATSDARWSGDCALAELRQLHDAIELWNRVFADADLAADQLLVDHLAANLRARGYRESTADVATCASSSPYPHEDPYDDTYEGLDCTCSAGGPGGLAPIALVLGALGFHRRRRRGTVRGCGAGARADAT